MISFFKYQICRAGNVDMLWLCLLGQLTSAIFSLHQGRVQFSSIYLILQEHLFLTNLAVLNSVSLKLKLVEFYFILFLS